MQALPTSELCPQPPLHTDLPLHGCGSSGFDSASNSAAGGYGHLLCREARMCCCPGPRRTQLLVCSGPAHWGSLGQRNTIRVKRGKGTCYARVAGVHQQADGQFLASVSPPSQLFSTPTLTGDRRGWGGTSTLLALASAPPPSSFSSAAALLRPATARAGLSHSAWPSLRALLSPAPLRLAASRLPLLMPLSLSLPSSSNSCSCGPSPSNSHSRSWSAALQRMAPDGVGSEP